MSILAKTIAVTSALIAAGRCNRSRKRIIKDLPNDVGTEVTEHTIHRDYCPQCQKHVEPVVPDALPKASLGRRFVCLTAWLHYGLGVTLSHIKAILGCHLHTALRSGGLLSTWYRPADVLTDWYEQIGQQARDSGHLRLRRREDFTPDRYARRIERIEKRLTQLLEPPTSIL